MLVALPNLFLFSATTACGTVKYGCEKSTACWNQYGALHGSLSTAATNVQVAVADVNTQTNVFTNLNTGGTFTNVFSLNSKDHVITDNGDGTITILVIATGGGRYYDTDGKLVLSDPGQTRFSIDIDYNGTPSDPADDVEIPDSFQVVRDSTGRNDTAGRDFCADLVEFTS